MYLALDNETPAAIAQKLDADLRTLLQLNAPRYKGLRATSRLIEGTVLELPRDAVRGDSLTVTSLQCAICFEEFKSMSANSRVYMLPCPWFADQIL